MSDQIPCPTCKTATGADKKTFLQQKNEKAESLDIQHLIPYAFTQFLIPLGAVAKALGINRTASVQTVSGKCVTCGNKGTVQNKLDRSKQIAAAQQSIASAKDSLLKKEAMLGPLGGNRHTFVLGDDMLEVGHGVNDSKSYTTVKDGEYVPAGGSVKQKGTIGTEAQKSNGTVGANALSTPGGHYIIKCSNKFTVYTGAQGIDFVSHGPITFNGGIMRFIGPQISIGTSAGTTAIEGQHLQLAGKSISMSPDPSGTGQVHVQGTLATSGNIIAAGGAHIEGDLSFISATCPVKRERTKFSSSSDQVTGPAQWQAQALTNGLKDYIRKITVQALDPSGPLISVRGIANILHDTLSLTKKALPIDPIPTGYVIGMPGTVTLPVFSYPHHHTIPDGLHSHGYDAPNIRTMDDDQAVRNASGVQCNSPVPQSANTGSTLKDLLNGVQAMVALVMRIF